MYIRDAPIIIKALLAAADLSADERSALDEVARGSSRDSSLLSFLLLLLPLSFSFSVSFSSLILPSLPPGPDACPAAKVPS